MTRGIGRRAFLHASGGLLVALTAACGDEAEDDALAQEAPIRQAPPDEDSYEAWLRYRRLSGAGARQAAALAAGLTVEGSGSVLDSARAELRRGLAAMLGDAFDPSARDVGIVAGTPETSAIVRATVRSDELDRVGPEGFVIKRARDRLVLASRANEGVLYGAFHLLRLLQTGARIADVADAPQVKLRMIEHWDNYEGGAERGYAGPSIFDFPAFPTIEERYVDYARMLASIGVNACAINNVNASVKFLETSFLTRLAPLAKLFEAYGIRLFLSANYGAPLRLGGLDTASPFDPRVAAFWDAKVAEIYRLVPSFGGFLVKANSEREPGPLDFGATHADGANLLARAVAAHGDGLVIWRAFVWKHDADRAKYAYDIFQPLDGQFDPNVVVQIKNGPIDFQVREPVHPLWGKMPKTQSMLELQITQEYTGQATHLCYLVPQWKEALDFDTRANGANGAGGSSATVAEILRGNVHEYRYAGMAGVRNVGRARNWTGHPLAAANLYGFGRLAWNPDLGSETIADEWTRMTFGNDPAVVGEVVPMLARSWSVYESYTSPLGSTFMCEGWEKNFDPLPETKWNLYYHRADDHRTTTDRAPGLGFDRVRSGYTRLYHPEVAARFESLATCPEELLLFFHHVAYEHRLSSGKSVIQHIYDSHFDGAEEARRMRERWNALKTRIDNARHAAILERFDAQVAHAETWRDSVVSYFFQMSGIRDAAREWIAVRRIRMPDEVRPGVPARVRVDLCNATSEDAQIAIRVAEPAVWRGEGTVTVPAASSGTFEVTVVPAANSTPVFEVTASTRSGRRPDVLGPRIAQYINKHGGLRSWAWA